MSTNKYIATRYEKRSNSILYDCLQLLDYHSPKNLREKWDKYCRLRPSINQLCVYNTICIIKKYIKQSAVMTG